MYNKKSKTAAILTIITAVLLVGFMVLLPFALSKTDLEGWAAIAAIFAFLFGFLPLYASALPFVIVGLVFGIKMLKQQSRKKLISYAARMLITACVLLPLLTWGLIGNSPLIFNSKMAPFPAIYMVVTATAYAVGLISYIVTIIVLKKSPEESDPTVTEQ